VIYNKDAKSTFDDVQLSKSPIKIRNFKRKANFKNNTIRDIQINKQTKIQVLEKATFPHQKPSVPTLPKVQVKEIIATGYDHQAVTIIGYISLKDCYATTFKDSARKKEVYLNDGTGAIALTLWNDHIDNVKTGGVYEVSNVKVRIFDGDDDKVLATISETTFNASNKKIVHKEAAFKLYRIMNFPVVDVEITNQKLICHKCGKEAGELTPGMDIIKCPCGVVSKSLQLKVSRLAKITIQENMEEITIFNSQLVEYAKNHHLGDRFTEESITLAMLKDDLSKVVVDRRNVCVCFTV